MLRYLYDYIKNENGSRNVYIYYKNDMCFISLIFLTYGTTYNSLEIISQRIVFDSENK